MDEGVPVLILIRREIVHQYTRRDQAVRLFQQGHLGCTRYFRREPAFSRRSR